jgi:hypothetical protein
MRIAIQLLATLIFLALFPAIVLGTLVVGIMAIWREAKPKLKLAPPVPTQSESAKPQPLVVKPIDYNRFPYGRDDIGGTC